MSAESLVLKFRRGAATSSAAYIYDVDVVDDVDKDDRDNGVLDGALLGLPSFP
jgi:hypothetical protein